MKIDEAARAIIQKFLFMESLVYMQPRGKDSTGVALLWDDNNTTVLKQPIPANKFARDDGLWGKDYKNPDDDKANYAELINQWMREWPDVKLSQALGHVRKKTVGTEYNPHNNHPIIVSSEDFKDGGPKSLGGPNERETVVGVHNGGLKNADSIFTKNDFKRIGQVDSEALFQLLYKHRNKWNKDTLESIFKELKGAWAALAYNPANPDVVAGLRETDRPLVGAFIKEISSLVLISEKAFINQALLQYDRWRLREANTVYSFVSDKGEKIELGRVCEVFPYLTVDIKDPIDQGVFLLDLQQEANNKTKTDDLVDVTYVTKSTFVDNRSSTYNSNRNTTANSGNTTTTPNSTNPNRGNTTTTASPADGNTTSSPTSTATKKKEDDGVEFVDTSEYEDIGNPLDKILAELDKSKDIDNSVIQISEDDIEILEPGNEDDIVPYDFVERLSMGKTVMYNELSEENDNMVINKVDGDTIKEFLAKNLVTVSSNEDAIAALSSFYELLWPEGYAVGFRDGFANCADEYEVEEEDDNEEVEKLNDEITKLKDKIASQTATIIKMGSMMSKLKGAIDDKKDKDKKRNIEVKRMAVLLKYFLYTRGVYNDDGSVNVKRAKEIQEKASFRQPSLVAAVANTMSNKK